MIFSQDKKSIKKRTTVRRAIVPFSGKGVIHRMLKTVGKSTEKNSVVYADSFRVDLINRVGYTFLSE